MMWDANPETSLSEKVNNYFADPIWFAWRPIVAETIDGCRKWVWWEKVKRERHAEMSRGPYGWAHRVYYSYKTLEQ